MSLTNEFLIFFSARKKKKISRRSYEDSIILVRPSAYENKYKAAVVKPES